MRKNKTMHPFKTIVVDKSSLSSLLSILSAAVLLVYGAISCAGFLFSHLSVSDEQNTLAHAAFENIIPALGDSGAQQNYRKNFVSALIGFDIADPKTILYSQLGALKIANAQAADAQTNKTHRHRRPPPPRRTTAAATANATQLWKRAASWAA